MKTKPFLTNWMAHTLDILWVVNQIKCGHYRAVFVLPFGLYWFDANLTEFLDDTSKHNKANNQPSTSHIVFIMYMSHMCSCLRT